MKVTILVLMMSCFLVTARAQDCDIAQTGVAVVNASNTAPVSTILTGQRANFKFSIANLGTSRNCTIPANSVTATLAFATTAAGAKPYVYDGPSTFVSGYFTWTYNSTTDVLQGVNINPIPTGKGDVNILVKVKAVLPGSAHSNLTLLQGNGVTDNGGNDYSAARITVVTNPVPIKLADFTVLPDRCDAQLKWSTASESNFSHFDVEYSPDGVTYIVIATIAGKNIATGADYKFAYNQLNGNGFYRLKLVDKDGEFEYSDIVSIKTNCKEQAKVLVYPNPVSYDQKLVVNISGYTGKISGELYDEAGQRMGAYDLVNGANELSVIKLSSGVYMLYVKSEDLGSKSFKVIITR